MPDFLGLGIEVEPIVRFQGLGIETARLIDLVESQTTTQIAYDGGGPALGTLGAGDDVAQGTDGTIGNTAANQGIQIT